MTTSFIQTIAFLLTGILVIILINGPVPRACFLRFTDRPFCSRSRCAAIPAGNIMQSLVLIIVPMMPVSGSLQNFPGRK